MDNSHPLARHMRSLVELQAMYLNEVMHMAQKDIEATRALTYLPTEVLELLIEHGQRGIVHLTGAQLLPLKMSIGQNTLNSLMKGERLSRWIGASEELDQLDVLVKRDGQRNGSTR
jgi:hypothetical protein